MRCVACWPWTPRARCACSPTASTARRSCTPTPCRWRRTAGSSSPTPRSASRRGPWARSTRRCSTSSSIRARAACWSSILSRPRPASSPGDCAFPTAIALSADEQSLLVAETGTYRVLKISRASEGIDVGAALRANAAGVTVLLDNLPGFPDNITRGEDGRYWTGFTKPRSPAIDAMSGRPWLRALTLRLPRVLWPVPPVYRPRDRLRRKGRVLLDLQDPTGKLPETSGATERGRHALRAEPARIGPRRAPARLRAEALGQVSPASPGHE